ncbi:hypothetical protein NDU88_000887 [Pleurodeles waltl]|uniref:Uncharacterized protein n=1 Tax=Pleurodeles waltl TaxID=8319 RepID=A0AAV7U5B2_PLEWA|nr:hypothetical protein NDU88_000887 [Pleurodeles waltl]
MGARDRCIQHFAPQRNRRTATETDLRGRHRLTGLPECPVCLIGLPKRVLSPSSQSGPQTPTVTYLGLRRPRRQGTKPCRQIARSLSAITIVVSAFPYLPGRQSQRRWPHRVP